MLPPRLKLPAAALTSPERMPAIPPGRSTNAPPPFWIPLPSNVSDTPDAAKRVFLTLPGWVTCWSNAKLPVRTVPPMSSIAPRAVTRTNGPAGSIRSNGSPAIRREAEAGVVPVLTSIRAVPTLRSTPGTSKTALTEKIPASPWALRSKAP